ncbi:MAG: DUF4440 domain-containing protein [Xanthomonadales bacterium]|nr:DUF4440 domain-containing protein [Xanthomonadales bacterium]
MKVTRALFLLLLTTCASAQQADVTPRHEQSPDAELAPGAPVETTGITSQMELGRVDLGAEVPGLDGWSLRTREITVGPGGTVGAHRHQGRPGMAYVVDGELLEHRSDAAEPLVRAAGEAAFEYTGLVHAWQNVSPAPARVVVVDLFPQAESLMDEQQALVDRLHGFLEGASRDDVETHRDFWADDLVYTSSSGARFGKRDILENLAAGPEDEAAPATTYTGEDVQARIFGGTAVVTFRLVGTPEDGGEVLEYFNTGTFVKRDGRWQAVAWQATRIPVAEAGVDAGADG